MSKTQTKPPTAKTPNQKKYIQTILNNDIIICTGLPGTGKTNIAVGMGIYLFCLGKYEKLVFSRPVLEAGENLGYLPGDMSEKLAPYIQPIMDELLFYIDAKQLGQLTKSEELEVCPIAFMRGRTFKNSYIIVDEAQNLSHDQMKMVITRLGTNSKMVFTGDVLQSDLPKSEQGALKKLKNMVNYYGFDKIAAIEMQPEDIQRHSLISTILHYWDSNA